MAQFSTQQFRHLLKITDVALIGGDVKESLTFLPFGLSIRNRFYELAMYELRQLKFQQVLLTDLISKDEAQKIDKIEPISHNYFHVNGSEVLMAASHDVPFYLFIRDLLRDPSRNVEFPLRYFHFGPGYRWSKNAKFPYNRGERKSFMECYGVYRNTTEAKLGLAEGIGWNRSFIKDTLHLPCIEVERPLLTNKRFSKKTICIDTLTPLGLTVITGMTYFQDDLYARILEVYYPDRKSKNRLYVSVSHFGLSENVLFSYLINSSTNRGLRLLNIIAPVQVSILCLKSIDVCGDNVVELQKYLTAKDIRYSTEILEMGKLKQKQVEQERRGIPLTIVVNRNPYQPECLYVYYNYQKLETNLERLLIDIPAYLEANDQAIIGDFDSRKQSSIIYCNSVSEVTAAVRNGLVAEFFMGNNDDKVLELERHLSGGEVLGFQSTAKSGVDILDGTTHNWVAFASKRA